MSGDYDAVVAALPRLTPAERGRVLARLKAMQSLAPMTAATEEDAAPASNAPEDELLEVIAAVVLRASGERATPATLRRVRGFAAFRHKAASVHEYAAKHAPDRVRRRALLVVGVELLYSHLASVGAASSRTLMSHAHRIPSAIDAAFPGYAQAGLLGMVLGAWKQQEER